jgi:hypothetical protein
MPRGKKVGTLRKQIVVMPDGSELERSVTKITQYTSYTPAMYRELGFVQAGGYQYMVERDLGTSLNWEPEYRETTWTVVEDIEPREKKPRVRSVLSSEEKEWLDDAVEWMLLEEYKPYRHVRGGWNLQSATPTGMALNLFDNYALWAVERGVGREAPESLSKVWDNYSLESYDLNRKKWSSQTASSLKRLEKQGIARVIWGPGMRGGEVKEYFHREYDDEG